MEVIYPILHLCPNKRDMQTIRKVYKCDGDTFMSFPATLNFDSNVMLRDYINPRKDLVGKEIIEWRDKLFEAVRHHSKVIIWNTSDIQSRLFCCLMCHIIKTDLYEINMSSLLDKERYVKYYSVPYLKKPIKSLCANFNYIDTKDFIAAGCLHHARLISEQKRSKYVALYDRLAKNDKGLRIFRNGRILNVTIDYYDKSLLMHIYNQLYSDTGKPIRAARLIGESMANLPYEEEIYGVESFLYRRIEHLHREGDMPMLIDMDKVKMQ